MLLTDPAAFWGFAYPAAARARRARADARPLALARLQAAGFVSALVTQAVDRLHTAAGSTDVVEVHGNVLTARCSRCEERYGLGEVGALIEAAADGVPRCTTPGCAFPLRPAGTLWGEPLHRAAPSGGRGTSPPGRLLLVIDSDLRTVPVSLLPSVPLTRGVPLVMIGETPTQYDRYAHVLIREAERTGAGRRCADLIAPRSDAASPFRSTARRRS